MLLHVAHAVALIFDSAVSCQLASCSQVNQELFLPWILHALIVMH